MTPIQWLLIGGSGHGVTLWIKQGGRVRYIPPLSKDVLELTDPGAHVGDIRYQLYEGENYLSEGRLYRIGTHQATPSQRDEIPGLIKQTRLASITGD